MANAFLLDHIKSLLKYVLQLNDKCHFEQFLLNELNGTGINIFKGGSSTIYY